MLTTGPPRNPRHKVSVFVELSDITPINQIKLSWLTPTRTPHELHINNCPFLKLLCQQWIGPTGFLETIADIWLIQCTFTQYAALLVAVLWAEDEFNIGYISSFRSEKLSFWWVITATRCFGTSIIKGRLAWNLTTYFFRSDQNAYIFFQFSLEYINWQIRFF